jgi:hypothetical protein
MSAGSGRYFPGMKFELAQVNIGRIRGPMESEVMRGFREALDEINALAEASAGFVWRFKTEAGNATSVSAFPDPLVLINLSVWESPAALRDYVYRSVHGKFFARRAEWFEKFEAPHLALWWVPAGERPTTAEARGRLASIAAQGPTPFAFTFRESFRPDGAAER